MKIQPQEVLTIPRLRTQSENIDWLVIIWCHKMICSIFPFKWLEWHMFILTNCTSLFLFVLLEHKPHVWQNWKNRNLSNCSIKREDHSIDPLLIWLASRAGKMNLITRCDWLPEQASHLACLGLPAVSRKKNFPKSHIINPLLTKSVQSRWLDIDLILFLWVYGRRLHLGP